MPPTLLRSPAAAAADVALVLAADSSGSVSDQDIDLQFQGYAEAITNSTFLNAVRSGHHGRIALAFFAWSSDEAQELLVPWILIDGISTARQFAATLLQAPGPKAGYTSISSAIDYAGRLLAECAFSSDRWVIDLSGDGFNNDGRAVTEARDEAITAGITINGLPRRMDHRGLLREERCRRAWGLRIGCTRHRKLPHRGASETSY